MQILELVMDRRRFQQPGLMAVAIFLCVSAVFAQKSGSGGVEPSRGIGTAALELLRDDDLGKALDTLGAAADRTRSLELTEDDGLSAATGGLHRALVQLSDEEQFDLLYKWSMPTETRQTVRLLTTLVPQVAPPKAFARALGERPRDTSFPVSSIGQVRGLFSTGWSLVRSADEVGRLRRLTIELEQLTAKKVPNADVLLLLARLAAARSDLAELTKSLEERASIMSDTLLKNQSGNAGPYGPTTVIDPSNVVLAAAALTHASLRPISEEMFNSLVELTYGRSSSRSRPFLRLAHATAVQMNRGESGADVIRQNQLKYWVPSSGRTSDLHAGGAVNATWLVHEDHILHLAGTSNDVLFLRYPLTGKFEFLCEAQEGGRIMTDGGLVYGGLQFQALGSTSQLTVWGADTAHFVQKPCPFVRHENRPTFNRMSIRSTADQAVLTANLHPVWTSPDAKQSPWLGLRSFAERRPMFRNLTITGNPVIPREVKLSDGQSLLGWRSGFYGETQSSPFAQKPGIATAPVDWHLADGVIHGAKREAPSGMNPQSRLHYQRPLLDGETIEYEFHYEPGVFEVHPALGRLAFLIEPDGVRVHWMTDGEKEWTMLPIDNAVLEPLNRRGPRQLPLKEKDWNTVKVARADGKVTLSLNNTVIYQRPIDFGGDHTFGFYRDRTQSAARIRNVVMTGDWPKVLPDDFIANPAISAIGDQASADRRALNNLTNDEFISEDVRHVRQRASELSPNERFEFLARWILPAAGHPEFRVSGEFTQADPAPISRQAGGQLVSPVFDLLDAAAETDRLAELADRIAQTVESHQEFQQRARAALLVLVSLERNESNDADKAFRELQSLVRKAEPKGLQDQWPETLVVYRGVHQFAGYEAVGDLLTFIYLQRTMRRIPRNVDGLHTQIASLESRYRHLQSGGSHESFESADGLADWISIVRTRARSRGDGFAQVHWHRNEMNEIHHLSGHDVEFLVYRQPLRGNFELECDVSASGLTQVFAAGLFFGPSSDLTRLETGTFRRGVTARDPLERQFSKMDAWLRYRAVFRDGTYTVFLNGRRVHEQRLKDDYDPWFGIHSWWRNNAGIRNVRITGNPEIPQAVAMSASEDLIGWTPYYFETVGHHAVDWYYVDHPGSASTSPAGDGTVSILPGQDANLSNAGGGQIIGRRRTKIHGSYLESLLRYHRPMVEDGTIEYEFFYSPGQTNTHPALDRLAFLIEPNGVQLHWITDGQFDRTDVPPDNAFDEPEDRRGPEKLPLRSDQWNQMRLSFAGDTVTIELNGQRVYERRLDSANSRAFGLFHFADQTQVQVRNVIMRGDWPRTVPAKFEKGLADSLVARLDADLPDMTPMFVHDFTVEGLPSRYFSLPTTASKGRITPTADGVLHSHSSTGKWAHSDITPQFELRDDFDVTVRFDDLKMTESNHCGCGIMFTCADGFQINVSRRRRSLNSHVIIVGWQTPAGIGGFRRNNDSLLTEAAAGRFRVARRGDTYFVLFAEYDSSVFRLVGRQTIDGAGQQSAQLLIRMMANNSGNASVFWKNVRIAAKELMLLPDPQNRLKSVLFVMNVDGTGLRQVTKGTPEIGGDGSPDWSPDGRQIAFDCWTGRAETSHTFIVNTDGTGLKDLGIGAMPNFSPDGKRLAFTWSGHGMAIMNTDGTNRQVITEEGWGAQWSPDGRWIAYESRQRTGNSYSANITIIDIKTKEKRQLLDGDQATRYSQIIWNMEWSPDSKRICFKGEVKNAQSEMAITSIDGSSKSFKVLTKENVSSDFSWHPDSSSILMAMKSSAHSGIRLFLCDPATGEIAILKTQPMTQKNNSGIWSPDGRRIVFSSTLEPQPVPWQPVVSKAKESTLLKSLLDFFN